MSITFKLQGDAHQVINNLAGSLQPADRKRMMAVLGRTGEKVFRAHFRKRDSATPNKQGWPRQHFWSRLAKVTAYDPAQTTPEKAVVVVADPALSAKVHGAIIRPTAGRRMLAIPMRPEAYGVRPSSGIIPGLRLLGGRGGALYLGKREEGGFRNLVFYYRLVPRVKVPADPQALPPKPLVEAELGRTASAFLRRNT